jgi:hypothetical protein
LWSRQRTVRGSQRLSPRYVTSRHNSTRLSPIWVTNSLNGLFWKKYFQIWKIIKTNSKTSLNFSEAQKNWKVYENSYVRIFDSPKICSTIWINNIINIYWI